MGKLRIAIFFITVFLIISICIGYLFYKIINNESEKSGEYLISKTKDETQIDKLENEVFPTNSEEIRTSPNATIIKMIYYKKCGHIIKEYIDVPEILVNSNETEIRKKYNEWELQSFTRNEIVLYKEKNEFCNEHYILRENDKIINIYKTDENGNEILYEQTKISTEYLTENDLEELKQGIKANGKEELNRIIENYE